MDVLSIRSGTAAVIRGGWRGGVAEPGEVGQEESCGWGRWRSLDHSP